MKLLFWTLAKEQYETFYTRNNGELYGRGWSTINTLLRKLIRIFVYGVLYMVCSIKVASIPSNSFIRVEGECHGLNVHIMAVVVITWVFWTYHGHYERNPNQILP